MAKDDKLPKGATPSSAERFSDNPIGTFTKGTPESRALAKKEFEKLKAKEQALRDAKKPS